MRFSENGFPNAWKSQAGFSLIEVMVGAGVLGTTIVVLAAGMNSAFSVARLNSENLRATQILTEKMDLIRACTWSQLTNGYTFIPSTFIEPFYTSNSPGSSTNFVYQGTVTIGNTPVTESYSSQLRQVTVTVSWTSANAARSRTMNTFVSRYGIQNYSQ